MTIIEWMVISAAVSTAASLALLAVWEIVARVRRHHAHGRAKQRVLREFAVPGPSFPAGDDPQ